MVFEDVSFPAYSRGCRAGAASNFRASPETFLRIIHQQYNLALLFCEFRRIRGCCVTTARKKYATLCSHFINKRNGRTQKALR